MFILIEGKKFMDSKIPKPAGFQRKPVNLFDFNSIKKAKEDAAAAAVNKKPLTGEIKYISVNQ